MNPEPYWERLKDSKDPQALRLKMVQFCLENHQNISLTAKTFRCHPKTVKHWLNRFQQLGPKGLIDQRGKHQTRPNKTPQEIEAYIVSLKKKHPYAGQASLQILLEQQYHIHKSTSTINRILHKHHFIKPKKKRWKQQKELSALRKTISPLKHFQIDVKYLNDLASLWPLIYLNKLPKYQYTLRDIATGITFISFAYELSIQNSMKFAVWVLEHLARCGVDLKKVSMQSDWGVEFMGPANAKSISPFVKLLEQTYGVAHRTIPPASPRFNGSVENFHARIQEELYLVEPITSEKELLDKSTSYLLFYHFKRPHRGLQDKPIAPYSFLKTKWPNASPALVFLPPIILDKLPLYPNQLINQPSPHKPRKVLTDHFIFLHIKMKLHLIS